MDKTVLVLEDSKTQTQIIRTMMERMGWTVVACETVRDALTSLAQVGVQALMLDVFVGQHNALLHIDQLRRLAPNVPLIVMTAGSSAEAVEDTLRNARRAGADYVLRKPFTENLLRSILDTAGPDIDAGERRRHILVIDDSQTIRHFCRRTLEDAGYRVSVAPSMEGAFSNIDIAHVDLVVCDVFMPGMGGLKGMRTIRTTWPKVSLLAMSAGLENHVSNDEALNATRRIGVDGQIRKPFTPDELLEVTKVLLEPCTPVLNQTG